MSRNWAPREKIDYMERYGQNVRRESTEGMNTVVYVYAIANVRAAELNYHAWSDASTYVLHATVNRIYDSHERKKCVQYYIRIPDTAKRIGWIIRVGRAR